MDDLVNNLWATYPAQGALQNLRKASLFYCMVVFRIYAAWNSDDA